MGLKFAKQGLGKAESSDLTCAQLSLINCITKSSYIRNWVSKHRRRMLVAGYDLDMPYITGHILAMSFPSEHMRAMYRNPLWQIYNLCIEETYDPSHFHGRVETYPFDDNHVSPLEMVRLFFERVDSWLSSDPRNIAVIHCMAGKGRTGLMVCSYLVYRGMTAEDALQLYANKRTNNNQGVSIPSQRRYVGYWADVPCFPKKTGDSHRPPKVILPKSRSRELRRIRLYDMVNTESVFFVVSELQEIPSQLYRPPVEVAKSCLRPITKGYRRNNSPRYYIYFTEGDEEEEDLRPPESCIIVQMDTESPIIYPQDYSSPLF